MVARHTICTCKTANINKGTPALSVVCLKDKMMLSVRRKNEQSHIDQKVLLGAPW